MRYLSTVLFGFIIVFSSLLSCGGSDQLGVVGTDSITKEDYLAVFNNLPPDNQVAVLEPGGRMQLMERIVRKKLLLTAWAENPSVSTELEELYSISMLSDSMLQEIGMNFDYENYIDSMETCGYGEFSLRVVLLNDSTDALQMVAQWNNGIFDVVVPSLNAPWSLADGSSYRVFTGTIDRITPVFFPVLKMELGMAHAIRMFGGWGVCLLTFNEGEFIPEESLASLGFLNKVASIANLTILSSGITALAENCSINGMRLIPISNGGSEPVVIYGSDTLSVADISYIMTKTNPVAFPGEVSEELAVFSPPELYLTKEATLWFYVKAVAQRYRLAQLALEQGFVLEPGLLDYARAESVVLNRVYAESAPDSSEVVEWYNNNLDVFILPERRSVLLAYTDTTLVGEPSELLVFSDLNPCQTVLDEDGNLVPTPLQPEITFGRVLGDAIFAADSGTFTGPISLDGELDAWFEVIEIAEEEIAPLDLVFMQAEVMAASVKFSEEFDTLITDLTEKYTVTIDTSEVINVDLWGTSQ